MIKKYTQPILHNILGFFFLLIILLGSCVNNKEEDKIQQEVIDTLLSENESSETKFDKAKRIFYSLPSPIELAMLIKSTGTNFDSEIMLSIDKYLNYQTDKEKALILGIYSADLSYSSLFEQGHLATQYLATSKKLADDLGIIDAISEEDLEVMETNIHNPTLCIAIISQSFLNSNSYLIENKRDKTATFIVIGGWIEALYLSTHLSENQNSENKELIDKIVDQRLSLNTLLDLLNDYNDSQDFDDIVEMMKDLKAIFDEIEVETSEVVATEDTENKITHLQSTTNYTISNEVLEKLYSKTEEIRTAIID